MTLTLSLNRALRSTLPKHIFDKLSPVRNLRSANSLLRAYVVFPSIAMAQLY